jgi:hypothetical protein
MIPVPSRVNVAGKHSAILNDFLFPTGGQFHHFLHQWHEPVTELPTLTAPASVCRLFGAPVVPANALGQPLL